MPKPLFHRLSLEVGESINVCQRRPSTPLTPQSLADFELTQTIDQARKLGRPAARGSDSNGSSGRSLRLVVTDWSPRHLFAKAACLLTFTCPPAPPVGYSHLFTDMRAKNETPPAPETPGLIRPRLPRRRRDPARPLAGPVQARSGPEQARAPPPLPARGF